MWRTDCVGFSLIYVLACEGPQVQIWKMAAVFLPTRDTRFFGHVNNVFAARTATRSRVVSRRFMYIIYSRVRYQIFLQKQNKCPKVRFRKVPALFLWTRDTRLISAMSNLCSLRAPRRVRELYRGGFKYFHLFPCTIPGFLQKQNKYRQVRDFNLLGTKVGTPSILVPM